MKIDWWTLGLQTINVLVLLWVLQRFLLKPVQAMIAQRQKLTQQLSDAAGLAKQQAEQETVALKAQRSALAAERENLLQQAHSEAASASAELLAQARSEAAQLSAAARQGLQEERTQAEQELQNRAAALAAEMTRCLLAGLPAATLNRHFTALACAEILAMNTSEKNALLAGNASPAFVSASELDAATREEVNATVSAALGREVALTFSVEADLLAGVQLHFHYAHISSNLKADLQKISQQLSTEHDPAQFA